LLNRRATFAETLSVERMTTPEWRKLNVPTDLYTTERGEVLAWIQIVLADEEQAHLRVSTGPSQRDGAGAQTRRPGGGRPAPAPSRPPLTDPSTGAPTLQALRRDLAMHRWSPSADRSDPVLLALELRPARELPEDVHPEIAEAILRTVIEVAPIVVEGRTRWYRGLHDDVLLLLGEADGRNPRSVLGRLAGAAGGALAARGLPPIRLFARRLRVTGSHLGGLPAAR
jgi:hypothetical protein